MKRIVPVFILSLSLNSNAAIQNESNGIGSVLEILKLPAQNRRMVLRGQDEKYYKPFLDIAFDSKNSMSLRWQAVMAAAEVGGKKSIPVLMKAVEHDLWYMRNAALVALNQVSPAEGQKIAQKLLKDPALVVRSAAVETLAENSTLEVRDLLWNELDQKYNFKGQQSLWIRHQIVEALAKNPEKYELELFARILSDKDERLHGPAVAGLEKITGLKLDSKSNTSSETKSLNMKSSAMKSSGVKSSDVKATDMKSSDIKSTDTKSTDTKSSELVTRWKTYLKKERVVL